MDIFNYSRRSSNYLPFDTKLAKRFLVEEVGMISFFESRLTYTEMDNKNRQEWIALMKSVDTIKNRNCSEFRYVILKSLDGYSTRIPYNNQQSSARYITDVELEIPPVVVDYFQYQRNHYIAKVEECAIPESIDHVATAQVKINIVEPFFIRFNITKDGKRVNVLWNEFGSQVESEDVIEYGQVSNVLISTKQDVKYETVGMEVDQDYMIISDGLYNVFSGTPIGALWCDGQFGYFKYNVLFCPTDRVGLWMFDLRTSKCLYKTSGEPITEEEAYVRRTRSQTMCEEWSRFLGHSKN